MEEGLGLPDLQEVLVGVGHQAWEEVEGAGLEYWALMVEAVEEQRGTQKQVCERCGGCPVGAELPSSNGEMSIVVILLFFSDKLKLPLDMPVEEEGVGVEPSLTSYPYPEEVEVGEVAHQNLQLGEEEGAELLVPSGR